MGRKKERKPMEETVLDAPPVAEAEREPEVVPALDEVPEAVPVLYEVPEAAPVEEVLPAPRHEPRACPERPAEPLVTVYEFHGEGHCGLCDPYPRTELPDYPREVLAQVVVRLDSPEPVVGVRLADGTVRAQLKVAELSAEAKIALAELLGFLTRVPGRCSCETVSGAPAMAGRTHHPLCEVGR